MSRRTNAALTKPILVLIAFGFFKELEPSEPFLTPYLVQDKGITNDQLDNEVYPVWTYAYLCSLALVLLITDYLDYSPIIILEALSSFATRCLLIWTDSILSFQFMQFVYGLNSAAEVAYYTSVYRTVPKRRFLQITAWFRAAVLVGQTAAGILAQLLVSFSLVDYLGLNYISFGSVAIALCLSVWSAQIKLTPRRTIDDEDNQEDEAVQDAEHTGDSNHIGDDDDELLVIADDPSPPPAVAPTPRFTSIRHLFFKLWLSFKECYGHPVIRKWCLWWVLATCGDFQVENYMSTLWQDISPAQGASDVYNGGVTAAATSAGIIVSIALGYVRVDWTKHGEVALAALSGIDCAALFFASQTTNIWIAYICYVVFAAIYTLLITIISAEVAKALYNENYAFVFGCNMFFALALQTIMTLVVNNPTLNLDVRPQFVIYALFFGFIAVIFLAFSITQCLRRSCR